MLVNEENVQESELSLYLPSEGNIPTKRKDDNVIKHPTKCRSLIQVYFPLILQTYVLILDTILCTQILIHLNQDHKFYHLIFIGWITIIFITYVKELWRIFNALRVALKPIAAVQDNNNDGIPDWMAYLNHSQWIIIIAICHKLAWIQYKEAWINHKILPKKIQLFIDISLQNIPSIIITVFSLLQINEYHIKITGILSLIGSISCIIYHVYKILKYSTNLCLS